MSNYEILIWLHEQLLVFFDEHPELIEPIYDHLYKGFHARYVPEHLLQNEPELAYQWIWIYGYVSSPGVNGFTLDDLYKIVVEDLSLSEPEQLFYEDLDDEGC